VEFLSIFNVKPPLHERKALVLDALNDVSIHAFLCFDCETSPASKFLNSSTFERPPRASIRTIFQFYLHKSTKTLLNY